ncbi:hypothetical protein [Ensifer sp. Root127]|uniref:hypothetical protein n=1 Tax=Ensifer sp. Root127 TaxID=1736440 RepID=UPI000A6C0199|nr:hypothetical protein [Ensifer sp. Root127]
MKKPSRSGYIPPQRMHTDTLQNLLRRFGRDADNDRQLIALMGPKTYLSITAATFASLSMIGNVWIDKVQTSCAEPSDAGSGAGALAELSSIIDGDVLSSTAYQKELISIAEELRGQLPAELRDIFGMDEASFRNVLGDYARDGSAEVVARLRGGQEE